MKKAVLIACLFATGLASPVLAANARHPYANCNKRIDNCGPTGDNMTDQLNARQLGGGPGMQGGMNDGGMNNGGTPMQGHMNDGTMPTHGGPGLSR